MHAPGGEPEHSEPDRRAAAFRPMPITGNKSVSAKREVAFTVGG